MLVALYTLRKKVQKLSLGGALLNSTNMYTLDTNMYL